MKKIIPLPISIVSLIIVGLLAANRLANGSLKGTISPADAGVRAWAVSATDTLQTGITGGSFEMKNVRPGIYKIIIEANAPYKNATKEGVAIRDGEATDIGQIVLQQ